MKFIVLNVVFGTMVLFGFSGCRQETAPAPAAAAASEVASNAPVVVAPTLNVYGILNGKWERPDGGYVLEVRNVGADGGLDAGYFNPSPIKVSEARAYQEGGNLKVFVELRDVNYPGCTYKLTYDAQNDQLFGQYYQAAMQQTYDVGFVRMK